MTSAEYQKRAHSFASYGDPSYPYFGLAEEAGEVCGKIAKFTRHNEGITPWLMAQSAPHARAEENAKFRNDLCKELGDCLWMIAEIATLNNLTIEGIMDSNIAKLTDRRDRGVIDGNGDNR